MTTETAKKEKTETKGKDSIYAVIATGGKQYVVHEGDILKIAKLDGDIKEGNKVTFDEVLIKDDGKTAKIGTPNIKGAVVEGTLIQEGRDKKVTVIKYKSKSRYFVKRGHRQDFMKVKINKI